MEGFMLAKILGFKKRNQEDQTVGERAGELFASGQNCAQAVLQSTTGIEDPRMLEMAEAFGGGVGDSKCLCGAISGGVMALGWSGKGSEAGELVSAFKERYRVTCCVALTRSYKWKSREHLSNCRKITEETAAIVERLLKK
jgi:C_GCAxxG_C_C family probable redox protein